jgi:hypothetical protein
VKRLLTGVSSAAVVGALLGLVGPVTSAGAVTQPYTCSNSAGLGFSLSVTVTGTGSVNTAEEPNEKFKVTNVVFTIPNPLSTPITVKNIVVTVPDPPTVAFLSGSTVGAGWVFSHPGTSTDTHAAAIVVPVAGSLSSGAMKMTYRDVSTDPPGGPGVVNWSSGNIRFKIISPTGYGTMTCRPSTAATPFATVNDTI